MEDIETRTAFITSPESHIIWLNYKLGVELTVEDIRENLEASLKLTQGKVHGAVLDTREKDVRITTEAMKYGASKEVTKYRLATAYLSTSLTGKLFGDFVLDHYRPKINHRVFTDDKEAMEWLRGFLPRPTATFHEF